MKYPGQSAVQRNFFTALEIECMVNNFLIEMTYQIYVFFRTENFFQTSTNKQGFDKIGKQIIDLRP